MARERDHSTHPHDGRQRPKTDTRANRYGTVTVVLSPVAVSVNVPSPLSV